MTAFRFSLQTVRDLRVDEERRKARALARARRSASIAAEAQDNLERILAASRRRLHEAHADGGSVGQIRNLARVVERLDARVREARRRTEAAASEIEECMREFREAHRARRALDLLRDRKREEWRAEQVRLEQRQADEVAVLRHARRDGASDVSPESRVAGSNR